MLKRIKIIKVNHVKIKFSRNIERNGCFLNDFNSLGVTEHDYLDYFNGSRLMIYKCTKSEVSRAIKKCPYCGEKPKAFQTHLLKKHNARLKDILILQFQKALYRELLKHIREQQDIFALAFTNKSCRLCANPVTINRKGLCSIPESSRNKVRNLNSLGFTCKNFRANWLQSNNIYGFIFIKSPSDRV